MNPNGYNVVKCEPKYDYSLSRKRIVMAEYTQLSKCWSVKSLTEWLSPIFIFQFYFMNLLFQTVRHAYKHRGGNTTICLRNLANIHGVYVPENNLVLSACS